MAGPAPVTRPTATHAPVSNDRTMNLFLMAAPFWVVSWESHAADSHRMSMAAGGATPDACRAAVARGTHPCHGRPGLHRVPLADGLPPISSIAAARLCCGGPSPSAVGGCKDDLLTGWSHE